MKNHPRKNRSRGFTLIELLVVVSIIALIISILLPALSQASTVSKTLRCLTQARQIGPAIDQYGTDFKDFIPVGFDTLNAGDDAIQSFGLSGSLHALAPGLGIFHTCRTIKLR